MVIEIVASRLDLPKSVVKNISDMVESGATIPFIARYRKEKTNSLDETRLREVVSEIEKEKKLQERKISILSTLQNRKMLTDELEQIITSCSTLAELDAVYAPFKSSKKTLAQKARELGIDTLVDDLITAPQGTAEKIQLFSKSKSIPVEKVEDGVVHIIAEKLANDSHSRAQIVEIARRKGTISNKIVPLDKRKARKGYEGQEERDSKLVEDEVIISIRKVKSHQIQAFKKAEMRGQIRVNWDFPDSEILLQLQRSFLNRVKRPDAKFRSLIKTSADSSYKRLLKPSISRQIYRELIEEAEKHAIKVFTSNLRNLLVQPPLKRKRILGLDPGLRTGTKCAIIDEKGDVIFVGTLNTLNQTKANKELQKIISDYSVEYIAIGNGTGSRDVEEIVKEATYGSSCNYSIVSEAGASVYSASEIAKEEFPDLDVSLRGAISIARRLQDPLAELVKIDPRSLGIGQYQHDVDQNILKKALEETMEDVVNLIGVDVNTASWPLLSYVSGLTKSTAKKIVSYRRNKTFMSREEIAKVKGIGSKTFEQAAGFLRIYGGNNPLDSTSIHPETYSIAKDFLKTLNRTSIDLVSDHPGLLRDLENLSSAEIENFSKLHNVGTPTLYDIIEALKNPTDDPRGEFIRDEFDQKIKTIDDLKTGLIVKGVVRNVTDFGAFVDVGVKRNALVHISELANKYVRHPSEIVKVGENIKVKILKIDGDRISASLKGVSEVIKEN